MGFLESFNIGDSERSSLVERESRFRLAMNTLAFCASGLIMSCAWGAYDIAVTSIAMRLHTKPAVLDPSYLMAGMGGCLGCIAVGPLYDRYAGATLMAMFFAAMTICTLGLAVDDSVALFFGINFCFGVTYAGVSSGCQLLTCWVYGTGAGPFLNLNSLCWAVGTALTPILFGQFHLVSHQFYAVSVLCMLAASFCFVLIDVQTPRAARLLARSTSYGTSESKPAHRGRWLVLALTGVTLFLASGSVSSLTGWLEVYAVHEHDASKHTAVYMQSLLWAAVMVGRLVGFVLSFLGYGPGNLIVVHALLGAASLLPMIIVPHSSDVLVVSIAFFGLFVGPMTGYAYDLGNQLTPATGTGFVVQMLGLMIGQFGLSFLAGTLYDEEASNLMWLMLLTSLVTCGPVLLMKNLLAKGTIAAYKVKDSEWVPSTDFHAYDMAPSVLW